MAIPMVHRSVKPACLVAVLLLAGCAAPRDGATGPGTAEAVYAAAQCAPADAPAGATWLGTREAYTQAYQALRGNRLNGGAPPEIDFTQSAMVLLRMGAQDTGGYSLALARERLVEQEGTVRMTVVWETPPADAFVSQARTSPCLMVRMPRGGYDAVRVVDQTGHERLSLAVPQ